jgi:hypothetical protein
MRRVPRCEREGYMRRRTYLLLSLFVAVVSICYAGIPTSRYTITVGGKEIGYMAVEEGNPIFRSPLPEGHGLEDIGEANWYVEGGRVKSRVGGKYLAYDVTGKDNTVFLADNTEDQTTAWVVHRPEGVLRRKNEKSHSIDEEWGVIQAKSGPMKGWYLDLADFEERTSDGKTITVRRFVLSKQPSWNIEVGRIYKHK